MNRASSATGWVRNLDGTLGWTWNPITGCLNGCEYCYARKLANGRLKSRYLANENIARHSLASRTVITDPFYPRFWPERITSGYAFMQNHKPMGIFPCDMSDWCGIGIPESWSNWILEMARRCPQHRFYLLTKQPQNLSKFSPFPDNCWVGVTATDNLASIEGLAGLGNIKAKVRFISFEPLLGEIVVNEGKLKRLIERVNWVIIGAQTKPYKPPRVEWVWEIIQACEKVGVPVFLKDNLKPLAEDEPLDPLLWADIHNDERGHERGSDELRQEMPSGN